MRNRFAIGLLLLLPTATVAQDKPISLNVAVFPYLPDAESAIEQLEAAFESHAKANGKLIDLDLTLLDTYSDLQGIKEFDVAEIDLCMLDALRVSGDLPLDEIPALAFPAGCKWVGPADAAMKRPAGKHTLPHWICGNFLVHWKSDEALNKADSFETILKSLDPEQGRHLYADLWGGGTLGEYYMDAVLDNEGPDEARKHLMDLASTPELEVKRKLRPDAVLALWRLTKEMQKEHQQNRSALHDLTFVYPKAFAGEPDSALIGYSERLHFLERRRQEEPWTGRKFPVAKDELVVRQFPFSATSKGTPTWCDAFVIPKGKLAGKHDAIVLFLEFAMSDNGYRCFLEPRQYYPGSYLLPASEQAYASEFVTQQMPSLLEYRKAIDASFPILDHEVYKGADAAGEHLKVLLKPAGE